MIDCKSSVERSRVVVVDWHDECYNDMPYTAVSHTYGMEVYDVFDCACAAEYIGTRQTSKPRSSRPICPGHASTSNGDNPYVRVVKDILGMCQVLWEKGGAQYVWHDGVCIAQHDQEEVDETIKHMGWIYSTAKDTIIFLHYVGTPMAPISHNPLQSGSRWHTRVWTIQEAAVSQRRRYCICMGFSSIFHCNSFEDLERELACWHDESSSQVVVVEEAEFRILVFELAELLGRLMNDFLSQSKGMAPPDLACMWVICIEGLIGRLRMSCTLFPTLLTALELCGLSESKHKGDRISSITTLAGLKNFVVPKSGDIFELSTIEFFKSQGQAGLATALFVGNLEEHRRPQPWKHSWLPDLTNPLASCDIRRPETFLHVAQLRTEEGSRIVDQAIQSDLVGIRLEVLPHPEANLELTGLWGFIKVNFNWIRHNEPSKNRISDGDNVIMDVYEEASIYTTFVPGFHTEDNQLGWMVASRKNRVEEPFTMAVLAFPAFKIVTYFSRAHETIMQRVEDYIQGPRSILIKPIQDATDVYQCIGRFFMSCHLRRILATSLKSSITICKRLVIV
ncbi:hypothetical protein L7F22_017195 [Adiantum nelumboides]|nr:hypothetical protein [Adiantum nelumboides]